MAEDVGWRASGRSIGEVGPFNEARVGAAETSIRPDCVVAYG